MHSSQQNPTDATRFTITVHDGGQATALAQRFISAALSAGHHIEQVFFYHDGVNAANANTAPAQDDPSAPELWPALAKRGNFPLNVCVAAGARRGVLSADEASRLNKPAANLQSGFELVGLGVFVEGLINADRVVTFGN